MYSCLRLSMSVYCYWSGCLVCLFFKVFSSFYFFVEYGGDLFLIPTLLFARTCERDRPGGGVAFSYIVSESLVSVEWKGRDDVLLFFFLFLSYCYARCSDNSREYV